MRLTHVTVSNFKWMWSAGRHSPSAGWWAGKSFGRTAGHEEAQGGKAMKSASMSVEGCE